MGLGLAVVGVLFLSSQIRAVYREMNDYDHSPHQLRQK